MVGLAAGLGVEMWKGEKKAVDGVVEMWKGFVSFYSVRKFFRAAVMIDCWSTPLPSPRSSSWRTWSFKAESGER